MFDYYEHDDDEEALQNYNYDLGYYEGIRNVLHMIVKNLQATNKNEKEKVKLLLLEVNLELEDAIKSQKNSEIRFFDTKERY
jgi:hypothetical protein